MSGTILREVRGGARLHAVLTLSNPGERNALTGGMRRGLIAALAEAEADPAVGAVMLRGEGDVSFCAGGSMSDLSGLAAHADCEAMCREGVALLNALRDFPKPIVAAVSGWCVGDGFELALCCDLIYASETAVFTMPEVDLGLTMGWGGAWLLEERLGLARTKEILMTGQRLEAGPALAMGLINRVLPPAELYPQAEELTARLATKPPLALRGIKALLSSEVLVGTYAGSQEFGSRLVADLMMTDDFHEAVAAFREKRMPEFRGR